MKTEKYQVSGMTCAACQANVTRCVGRLEGVSEVNVSLLANQMTVTYAEDQLSAQEIVQAVTEIGYGASPLGQNSQNGKAAKNSGSFEKEWQSRKDMAARNQKDMKKRLISSTAILIPLMYVAMGGMMGLPMPSIFIGMENALILALTQCLLTIPVIAINWHFFHNGFKALIMRAPNMDSLVAVGSSASFLYGVFAIYRMAYGLGHGQPELVHQYSHDLYFESAAMILTLVTVGKYLEARSKSKTSDALGKLVDLAPKTAQYSHDLYFESAAMILTLVTVGKYLEARSKSKTSDALGKLVDLAPKTALVIRNGEERAIPAEQVAAGDIVVIRPGMSIPVDGVVTEGSGYIDQSAITGESIPVEKNPGDEVICATINRNGSFRFQASRVGDDTTLAQIIRLVDDAGNSKAPIARLADKVSGWFVPAVILIAFLTAIVWLLAGSGFEFALSSAIAVLVISCPCALGLATPVAIMVGTGKAAEYGILIKSAASLEHLHSIDTIVLDKTGTITSGHPSVTDILVLDSALDEASFLAGAAAAESGSEHPLAQAVVERARKDGLTLPAVSGFEATAGRGIRAVVNGRVCHAGNPAYMEETLSLSSMPQASQVKEQMDAFASQGKTPLLFASDGELTGIIAVADTVRESSAAAIHQLQKMGLHVVMLTGDNRITASAIQKQLGIEEAISDVLPTQKEAHIRSLQEKGCRVAMVGDGINDAPALTRADIGIAIGAGTDIAIDSADVVLMKDSLLDVVTAIRLSRAVIRNIRMNLFWAFFYNILGIPLAAGALFPAFGLRLTPMFGSAAMSLSSVCVVTNALRLRFFRSEEKDDAAKTAHQGNLPAAAETNAETGNSAEMEKSTQIKKETNQKGDFTMKKIVTVEGMMCAHCQAHVQKALAALEGVTAVEVCAPTARPMYRRPWPPWRA